MGLLHGQGSGGDLDVISATHLDLLTLVVHRSGVGIISVRSEVFLLGLVRGGGGGGARGWGRGGQLGQQLVPAGGEGAGLLQQRLQRVDSV